MSSDCPLDVDVRNKLASVGAELEPGIRSWIEGMTGERFPPGSFAKGLKNGVLLCKLANKIRPGICPKFQASTMPFVQMENIGSYLNAAKKLGVPSTDLFMTVDLYEEKNIGQVIRNLDVLRRITNTGNVASSSGASYSSPSSYSSPPPARSSPSPVSSPRVATQTYSPTPARTAVSPRAAPASPRAAHGSPSPGPALPARVAVVSPRVPVGVAGNTASGTDPLCPLDKDLKDKLSQVGAGLEGDIRSWVERMTGERFPDPSFAKSLKNGVILCKLVNKIRPGICPKVQNSPAPFVQMENIGNYLAAARALGVGAADLFMTVDLYEEKNVGQVIRNLDVLRRVTGKY